ncbi:MAG: glycosyltransferase family 4 protein [Phenylobacterium sp.]
MILFEPDGYSVTAAHLLGRHMAGNGFLRAAVKAHAGQPLVGYSPANASGAAFRQMVLAIDPAARAQWLPADRLELIGDRGVFYRPDYQIGQSARARLRVGLDRYSICGVTHTLASARAMEGIVELLVAPTAPWDALICTSQAAVDVIEGAWAAQVDYLKWRFGEGVSVGRPLLPKIPLGVHCDDFAIVPGLRDEARAALELADDEVAVLFAGRLSFNAKAHPYAMYVGLQETARRTGRKLVLIQAGRFFNAGIEAAYRSAVAQFCPDVRAVFVDGADADLYRKAWAAADVFMSLADNIQETFGLTPLEAMAAGLPLIVTDWNGYKETVRAGVDGYRIPTGAPAPGAGEAIGRASEVGILDYDFYVSRTSTTVALDMGVLVDRLSDLVSDPALRRRMGEAGRRRAREIYDWSAIYPQYQALWTELNAIRCKDRDDSVGEAWIAAAPRVAPARRDPFEAFKDYPTALIGPDTIVSLTPGATAGRYATLVEHPLWENWKSPVSLVETLFARLSAGDMSVRELTMSLAKSADVVTELTARLAKMGLVKVEKA